MCTQSRIKGQITTGLKSETQKATHKSQKRLPKGISNPSLKKPQLSYFASKASILERMHNENV